MIFECSLSALLAVQCVLTINKT